MMPTTFFVALLTALLFSLAYARLGEASKTGSSGLHGNRGIKLNFKSIPLVLANSENGDEDDDRGSSASVQFMITNKMKKMLVNDLGYSLGEVDDMEPQIAAVVIEKSLSRPKAGMPASWRKSNREVSKSEKRMKAIKKNWRRVKSFVMDAGSTLQMHLWEASQRPAVRGVALTVLIWLARHSLQSFAVASLDTTRNAVQNFLLSEPSPPEVQQQVPKQTPFSKRSLLSVLEDRPNLAAPAQPHVRRPWWNIGGIFSRGGNSEKVNLKALGQVRKLGFLDSLRVRLDIFKMGL